MKTKFSHQYNYEQSKDFRRSGFWMYICHLVSIVQKNAATTSDQLWNRERKKNWSGRSRSRICVVEPGLKRSTAVYGSWVFDSAKEEINSPKINRRLNSCGRCRRDDLHSILTPPCDICWTRYSNLAFSSFCNQLSELCWLEPLNRWMHGSKYQWSTLIIISKSLPPGYQNWNFSKILVFGGRIQGERIFCIPKLNMWVNSMLNLQWHNANFI